MTTTLGYAAQGPKTPLAPFRFERREPRENDVEIETLYCGVCHSDIHQARDEWGGSTFPIVPGHEIVGKVKRVGSKVTRFKVGDLAGVGCLVDSCRTCSNCKEGNEQYCMNGFVGTYNGIEKDGKTRTYGGYSDLIVVDQDFTLKIPSNLDLKAVAPLLCAGITTYSPLRHWKVGKNSTVGVVGLGGLGHMGVKLAHSFGAHVTVFTTSEKKKADALKLGADAVVISTDEKQMADQMGKFDFILNTVAATHNINALSSCLKHDATMVLVGAPDKPHSMEVFPLIMGRRSLAGSLIGGIAETQEMLDYCGKHGITADIEVIPINKINEAYERMMKGDVHYRFVIDLKSIQK